jgi:hypothetical protein
MQKLKGAKEPPLKHCPVSEEKFAKTWAAFMKKAREHKLRKLCRAK